MDEINKAPAQTPKNEETQSLVSDTLKENLPLVSALLLVLGAVRLIVYYHFFGIDITNYIDLSEIFSLSLSFFITSIAFLTTIVIVSFILRILEGDYYGTRLTILSAPSNTDRGMISIAYYIIVWLGIFTFPLVFIYAPPKERVNWDILLIAIPLFAFLPPIIPDWHRIINKAYKKLFDKDLNGNNLFLITISVLVLCFSIVFTRTSARRVLYDDETIVKMLYDGKLIQTDSSYKFIGKTKSYAFFYNDKTGYSDVYEMSNVKSFSIKDNDAHRRNISTRRKKSVLQKLKHVKSDTTDSKKHTNEYQR